jgi:hypothetical protein
MCVMAQDAAQDVRASELIAAVSLAVDIGMAQPLETGLAVGLVAVGLAERLGYEPGLMQRTFRLALLQHVGCTVAAAPVAAIMGDELVMRAHAATLDFVGRTGLGASRRPDASVTGVVHGRLPAFSSLRYRPANMFLTGP